MCPPGASRDDDGDGGGTAASDGGSSPPSPEEATTTSSSSTSRPDNPLAQASWLSKLFFAWPYPLLRLGMERPLEEGDVAHVLPRDRSKYNRDYLLALWDDEKRRALRKQQQHPHPGGGVGKPSLHRALARNYFKTTWYIQPMLLVGQTARVVQAVMLGYLIESFEETNDRGYLWASIIVICGIVLLFEHHHVFFFTWRKGMQLRAACVAAVQDKSLRLSSTHQDTTASYGRIMNLASNDVERFLLASLFVNYLFWGPVQALGILVVGVFIVGPAFAAGFALLVVVFVPLQFHLSKKFGYYRSTIAAITDQRVTFVSQAVRGARVMKVSGYEWRFLDRIEEYRKREVRQIAKANNLKAVNEALFFVTSPVISLVIFLVVVATGGTLETGAVFTVFTLINIMQLELIKHMSLAVMACSEVYVSLTRIQKFLEFPELSSETAAESGSCSAAAAAAAAAATEVIENDQDGILLSLSNITCYWNDVERMQSKDDHDDDDDDIDDDQTDSSFASVYRALDDVTLDFRRGELTAVIGAVGSGKSALLQALVKELPISTGKVTRRYRTLAYAAQDPWIMDGTVRENILLGLDFNQEWYNEVVKACGMVLDLQQFRDGDQTVVGDRGVQCSGGQRARIGLARALYRDADVLILDDPLSAVDAKVGRQLFQEAIKGLGIDRGKCVVLATHQHQYLNECRCVVVSYGKVSCVGSYDECVEASGGQLKAHSAHDAIDNLTEDAQVFSSNEENDEELDKKDDAESEVENNKEMSVQGVVSMSTYFNYMRAMGGIGTGFGLIVLFCVTQASLLTLVVFMGEWAERPKEQQDDWDILGLVIGLGVLVVFFAVARAFVSFRLTVKASGRLHDRMAKAVLRAKIEFFDTNPLGRIVNRFSADVGSNDDLLPATLFDFSMIAFMVLGALVTTVIILPITLIAIPPLLWYFLSVRRIFVTSTRELKRLEGIARSPIFATLSESLGGIASIRANDAVQFFKSKFQKAHDGHTRAFFAFMSSSRWVGFRMDSIMFLFLAVSCFLSVVFSKSTWSNAAVLGLALSMLLQLGGIFQWCIRQSAEVVNQMVSVERVLAFGDLEPEAPLVNEEDQPLLDAGWPKQGRLDVQDLSVRYRSTLPLVLEEVSFSIPHGARVGIVGRTGSGKSSLVQTFFRLLEAEQGRILLDGVDVSQLGLHALRTHISVLPQVPTLFSGCTVRENLDLFNLHSDDAIRKVLEDCHMAKVIDALPDGLNSLVSENGSNFSVGQRQLLCLARAILDENKILVLDEATASVDRRTDELLQEALQKTFSDGTIIAVAHRLDTVIESDYILVMGGGRVLEFGPPADLIRGGGAFASMVGDTGEAMSDELRQRAFTKERSKTEEEEQHQSTQANESTMFVHC